MNKKLLTLAVGAALVGAFSVAQADVKINGTINGSLDYIKGKNSATATDNSNKLDVSSNASNVVINADEDLGGGLKGVFSWQEFVRMDNNNSGNAALSGGNTWVGLSSAAAGTVLLGNNDSGAKLNGAAFDLFNNQIGDSRNLDRANNRVGNLIAYVSPNLAGFSLLAAHSTNTLAAATPNSGGLGAASPDTAAAGDNSVTANSLKLSYTLGTLLAGIGYDKVSGSGTTSGAADKWLNAGVKYGLPSGTDLLAFYQKHSDAGTALGAPAGTDLKLYGLGVAQQIPGNNVIKAQYYKLKGDSAGTSADMGKMWAIGFDHNFSKTYTGYLAYASTKNDNGNSLSMAGGGHGDNPGSVAGQTMSGFSVGAIMKF